MRQPEHRTVLLWVKLRQKRYTRSISGLYSVLIRSGQMAIKIPNLKYIPKPYEQMKYPGQQEQIDMKFVPDRRLASPARQRNTSFTNTHSLMNTAVFAI